MVNAPAFLGRKTLHALAQKTARAARYGASRMAVSVAYVDVRRSREANEQYRRKQGPTDVLSFPFSPEVKGGGSAEYLGEILLCPTIIRQRAPIHKRTIRAETTRLFVHGMLHLLGYDHTGVKGHKKMFALEERILGTAMLAGDEEHG